MTSLKSFRPSDSSPASTIALFALMFGLASGGLAMAASCYAHALRGARAVAPQPASPARTIAMGDWRPTGCVFPPTSAFGLR